MQREFNPDEPELMDRPQPVSEELEADLLNLVSLNRHFGSHRLVRRFLSLWLKRGQSYRILDLATGAGDIPYAIAAWAASADLPVRLTVADLSPQILAEARRTLARVPGVTFTICDARSVPFPDDSFDVVLCSLSLHHFAPGEAVQVLREMDRLSRTGFILNDIRRGLAGYVAAWAASRVATRNPLTRHDMPLSVLRAYTPDELRALLRQADIHDAPVTTHLLFRMAAVHRQRGA